MERFTDELTAFKWLADKDPAPRSNALNMLIHHGHRSTAFQYSSENRMAKFVVGIPLPGGPFIKPLATGNTAIECANQLLDLLQRKAHHDPARSCRNDHRHRLGAP